MRSREFPILFALCGTIFLFTQCTTQTNISLQTDGSASISLAITLHPILIRYYTDLATGFIPTFDPQNPKVFDTNAIKNHFEKEKNLTLISVQTPFVERLEASFHAPNLQTVFADPKAGNIVTLDRRGAETRIRIHLNRERVNTLLALAPDSQSPLFQMLLPPMGRPISAEEYHAQLSWALEEYGPKEELNRMLLDARIEVRLQTPGPILHNRGGILESPNTIRFRMPLLRLLTTPVEFEVTYRNR